MEFLKPNSILESLFTMQLKTRMFVLEVKSWHFVSVFTRMNLNEVGFIGLLVVQFVFLGENIRGTNMEGLWLGLGLMAQLII
jgi:hypothetical protein